MSNLKMQKPLTLLRNDYMNALANLSNQSGLPAFVMLEVVERMKSQLEKLAEAQLQQDTAAYAKALEKEKDIDKEA